VPVPLSLSNLPVSLTTCHTPLSSSFGLPSGSSDEHGLDGPFDVGFVSVRFGELKIAARFAANAGHDVVSAIFLKVINSAQTPTSRASRVG
jgi:hypothetical protein